MSKTGVDLRVFPQDVLDGLFKYTEETLNELIETDPASRKVYAHYNNFRNNIKGWAKYSEKTFYNLVQR